MTAPRGMRYLVAELAAVAAMVVLTDAQVSGLDWERFAFLLVAAMTHTELSRRGPGVLVWLLAGALLLPLPAEALLGVVVCAHLYVRSWRHDPRALFVACTAVTGGVVATAVPPVLLGGLALAVVVLRRTDTLLGLATLSLGGITAELLATRPLLV